jgi:probable rRNA maturation factor
MVSAAEISMPEWSKHLQSFARRVLVQLGRDKWDISVFLCGDKTIKKYNSIYRGIHTPTDVLAFPPGEQEFPPGNKAGGGRYYGGDLIISLDTLRKNTRRFRLDVDEELRRLLIHGILHLDGMDHSGFIQSADSLSGGSEETEPMLQLQEDILKRLSKYHIMTEELS